MLSIYFSSRDLSACPIRERRFSKCLGGWKAAAPRDESVSEAGRINKQNNSSLNEEPGTISRQNKHGKSYKCSGKPSAPETSDKKSERLPRSPVKAFSLRQGRGDEGAVLGVSRP